MPIARVQLPDGRIGRFEVAEGTPPEEVESLALQSLKSPSGFIERSKEDFAQRKAQWDKADAMQESGQQGTLAGGIQKAGAYAGGVTDLVGNAIGSVARYGRDLIPQPIDDFAVNEIDAAKSALADSMLGRGVSNVAKKGQELAQEYPVTAATLGGVANIASVIPAVKAAGVMANAGGKAVSNVGSAIKGAGEGMLNARKGEFVKDLVAPKLTPTVKAERFARSTEEGLSNKAVYNPTPWEAEGIDAISQLPVKKGNSLLKNHNIISEANKAEGEALKNYLITNDVKITDDVLNNALADVRNELGNPELHPYIIGDGAKAAENVVNAALNTVVKNPKTASGLLQARKDFDKLVNPNQFHPDLYKPVNVAIQKVRQTLNDLVANAVPSAQVKQSLAKQSQYISALENIESKGGLEAGNRFSRTAQKAAGGIPGKTLAAKAAVGAGITGAGIVAPSVVAPAVAAVGAYKALPHVLKAAGFTLDQTGKLLKNGAKVTARDIGLLAPAQAIELLKLNQGNQQ